jgi:hypothetical protein
MAMQTISPFEHPYLSNQGSTSPSLGSTLIDADNEAIAGVLVVPYGMNIATLMFKTGTVTTGGDLIVEVQTLDASGDPSGTLWATNTSGTITVNATDDNVWLEKALTANAVVAGGQLVAFVIRRPVGSTFAGNIVSTANGSTTWTPKVSNNYVDVFNTGAWVKNATQCSIVSFKDSNGAVYQVIDNLAIMTWANITYNNGSSPNRYGNRFRLTFPTRIVGLMLNVDMDGDFTIAVTDDSGTQLGVSPTYRAVDRSATVFGRAVGYFGTPVSITANTWYRVEVIPTTATSLILREVTVQAQAYLAVLGGGSDFYQCQRTDTGAFTDSTTHRTLMSLLLDQVSDGGGSGGGPLTGPGKLVRN